MPHTTLSYYKLKSPASILNSVLLFRSCNRAHVYLVNRLRSRTCLRLMRVLLLTVCVLIPLALPVQAQRSLAPTHIVLPGETLGLIAQSYGVDIYTLASLNGIANAHLIHTWQELAIPPSASFGNSAIVSRGTHTVQRGETLDGIAKSYGVSLSDLIALNGISRFIYPGQQLALPVPGRAPAPVQSEPIVTTEGTTHSVQYGETLGTIAAYYGISLYDLQAANNIWTWIIYVGQQLVIPGDGIGAVTRETPATPSTPIVATEGNTHTVLYGETLGTIASYYGISLYDLQAANNIWTWIIYVGQQLVIPGDGIGAVIRETPTAPSTPTQSPAPSPPQQSPAPSFNPQTHTVQRGETLFRIAQQYGVSLDALIRANGIVDATKIHSGLVLRVRDLDSFVPPPTVADPSPAPAPAYTGDREKYIVQPGEFLSQIGAKYGMSWLAIVEVNGIINPDSIHAGTVLQIPTAAEAAKYGPAFPTNNHPGARIGVGREFVVVLSTQTAYAYENGILQKRARISSGLPATPTVQGDFKIKSKVRSQSMTGPDYDLDNVEWVMYFHEAYAFHGTWWHYNFGSPMSHGCVNMTNADAKWFYDFGIVGTPVHVRFY